MTAAVDDDQLIGEVRRLLPLVTGHGMHVSVRGDQLRAILARIDSPTPAAPNGSSHPEPEPEPVEPAWQEPLSAIVRVVAEIIEDPAYTDLCGTNLVDALHAWAARNGTTIKPAALTSVDRALSGE